MYDKNLETLKIDRGLQKDFLSTQFYTSEYWFHCLSEHFAYFYLLSFFFFKRKDSVVALPSTTPTLLFIVSVKLIIKIHTVLYYRTVFFKMKIHEQIQ